MGQIIQFVRPKKESDTKMIDYLEDLTNQEPGELPDFFFECLEAFEERGFTIVPKATNGNKIKRGPTKS